ncbi:MAG: DUF488 family protein [Acidilobaceae archaeon]
MRKIVYTIGHSNRSVYDFIELLRAYNIRILVDVRRFPTSRVVPWVRRESLEEILRRENIEYYWLGEYLGGFRSSGYIKYKETQEYKTGLQKLLEIIEEKDSIALMCREKLWFKCHRRFISDDIADRGYKVIHIIEKNKTYEHRY